MPLYRSTFFFVFYSLHFQIAHVIREIRHFQQQPYKIEHIPKVTSYLLDASLLLDDDELYTRSLQIEPRSSRLSAPSIHNISKHERKTLGRGGGGGGDDGGGRD